MKLNLKKLYNISLLSLLVIGSWAVSAHAVDDVRVTNWPTTYSVTNTTWDSRLSTLQTTLQSLAADMSQFPTFVSRFGWNGTISFSQGFELLYNDVSDILTALNREFPSGTINLKTYISGINGRLAYDGRSISNYAYDISNSVSSIDSYTQHIDADLHYIKPRVNDISTNTLNIYDNVDTFRRAFNQYSASSLVYESNISSKANQIKADTGNISVDTEHISGTQDVLVSQGAITMRNVGILRDFFADDDTIARKEAAEAASGEALDQFTGNGSSSASVSDFADISDAAGKLNTSFETGQVSYVDSFQTINRPATGQNSPWAWFTQATYDSINPQPNRSGLLNANSYMAFYEEHLDLENRKGVSDTPLLDEYNRDIEKAIGK